MPGAACYRLFAGSGGALALVAALSLTPPASGQGEAPQPQAFQVRREGAFMRFAEEVELRLLLFAAAESVSTPIEYDPERLAGTVHMDPRRPYSAEELWEQAGRELRSRGLTTVQPPGSAALRVVALDQAASIARIEEPGLEGAVAGFVRVLRPLAHRQPSEVIDTLRLLVSQPGGSVSAAEEAGAVLIADYRPQVAQALRALNVLDVAEVDPGVLEVALEHLSPVAMGALLDRLAQSRKAVTGTDLRGKALPLAETKSLLWWPRPRSSRGGKTRSPASTDPSR